MIVNNDKMIKFKENVKPTKEENLIMTPQNIERFTQLKIQVISKAIRVNFGEPKKYNPEITNQIIERNGGLSAHEYTENEFRMIDFFENEKLSLYQQFKLCNLLITNYSRQLKAEYERQFCFYIIVDEETEIVSLRFHTYRDGKVYLNQEAIQGFEEAISYTIL